MSQPQPPVERTGRPGRYVRSSGGLMGALIVSVLLVGSFVGIRSLFLPDRPDAVSAVDWQPQVRAGRADGQILVPAPSAFPQGWTVTSATYTGNPEPSWRLGVLTDDEEFIGIFERLDGIDSLVEEQVDDDAERGDDVTLDGTTWQVWTDAGGDYGLAREVEEPSGRQGAVLVVGSASDDLVRTVAESLDYADGSETPQG